MQRHLIPDPKIQDCKTGVTIWDKKLYEDNTLYILKNTRVDVKHSIHRLYSLPTNNSVTQLHYTNA
jgi:hypothetical protein